MNAVPEKTERNNEPSPHPRIHSETCGWRCGPGAAGKRLRSQPPRFRLRTGFFCGRWFFFFLMLLFGCILVAKKQVSYCRCSKSKDKATVKIACYFDSSHIISIIDTVYLYIFTLTNGVSVLYSQIFHTYTKTHTHAF